MLELGEWCCCTRPLHGVPFVQEWPLDLANVGALKIEEGFGGYISLEYLE